MGRKSKKQILEEKLIEHEGVIEEVLEDEAFDNEEITHNDFFAIFQDKARKREFFKKVDLSEFDRGAFRKNLMISALIKSSCIVTQASKKIGITPQTHYNWIESDKEYAEKVSKLDNYVLDFVEGKLLQSINQGDAGNTRFFLSCKGKARGYGLEKKSENTSSQTSEQTNIFSAFFAGVNSGEAVNYLFFQLLDFIHNPDMKILVLRGGTRYAKTYEGMDLLLYLSFFDENVFYLVTRNTRPALEDGAKRDIDEIIERFNLSFTATKPSGKFQYVNNKTKVTIVLKAYAEVGRAEGHKYKYVFMDEAPRIPYGVYQQLRMRCYGKFILAFNPVDAECWVNLKIEQERKQEKQDVQVIIGNHRQNKFLEKPVRDEIEYFAEKDENYHRVHIRGEYGITKGLVYPNFEVITEDYFHKFSYEHLVFGCDWGYNDPMAVIAIKYDSRYRNLFVHEVFCESYVKNNGETAAEEIKKYCQFQKTDFKSKYVFCDHQPAEIKIMQDHNIFADPANKSRTDGVRTVGKTNIHITASSKNLLSEIRAYQFKSKNEGETYLDEPQDGKDHCLDALRYAFYSYYLRCGFEF